MTTVPESTRLRRDRRVPVAITLVTDDDEYREVQELRYRVGTTIGYVPWFDTDAYEATAHVFAARVTDGEQAGRLIGTVRLAGQIEGQFALERAGFTIPNDLPRHAMLEVGRWIALPSGGPFVSIALATAAEQVCRRDGITHPISTSTDSALRSIRRGGWSPFPIGDGRPVLARYGNDELFYPVILPPREEPLPLPAHIAITLP
jgi:hypothetical protein